jgi:hypothetical protein
MARLTLSLLGGFAASLDGNPLSGLKTDKARALLIYLAVERSRPHRRQALAGLFWPDYPEEGARANLRHTLANLRHVLGEKQNEKTFLLVESESLQLNPDSDCWVDVAEFEKLTVSSAVADLAVVGPSGSGKTSLIKAGLIPALRQGKVPGSEKWLILEMVPGEHPLEELEVGLLRLAGKALPGLMEQM